MALYEREPALIPPDLHIGWRLMALNTSIAAPILTSMLFPS